ncbi:MAG TPA: glycosyltransferase family 2 protein [Candidatus Saccharimonadales bacterium]|nr:glycosyltransferase family 2 protein [Candidatus Saccharimonadales bacterium]
MYRNLRVAAILPCYNEEKLISKTVTTMPDFVDEIIAIDDCSKDTTWQVITDLAKKNKRVQPIHLDVNEGIGGAYLHGFKKALDDSIDLVVTMAGDAQCNQDYISNMIDTLIDNNLDYVKANRFVHLGALKQMPKYRRIGNIIVTILTKFSTGYYSIFDSQNGYGVLRSKTLEKMSFETIGRRYDYENTLLITLSIMGAKVKDEPVPAIYGDEVSTIPVFKTTLRALVVVWKGFWKRIYYKYVIYGFHPIALFLFSGIILSLLGISYGIFILLEKIIRNLSPSTGTVMLCVLPLILGFQLLLTALTMDVNNEGK